MGELAKTVIGLNLWPLILKLWGRSDADDQALPLLQGLALDELVLSKAP